MPKLRKSLPQHQSLHHNMHQLPQLAADMLNQEALEEDMLAVTVIPNY